MTSDMLGGAASCLLSPLFDGEVHELVEVARTRLSVHYEIPSGSAKPSTVTVCLPAAMRLPNALVSERLPPESRATVGAGVLATPAGIWRVNRWWAPPRPRGLHPPARGVTELWPDASWLLSCGVPALRTAYDGLRPVELIGAGPGLTPAGDDLLAGALVTAHAIADRRLPQWRRAAREVLTADRTTAVSVAVLHAALEGYATPEVAEYLQAVCDNGSGAGQHGVDRATANLLAVGHSSGAALMTGVLHTLSTTRMQGAA